MQTSPCYIQMFGGLRIRSDEQLVTRFPTYKAGLLLARLAYPPARSYTREELIALLWPEVDPASGRLSLRQALSLLRRSLEPLGVEAGTLLMTDRYRVQL